MTALTEGTQDVPDVQAGRPGERLHHLVAVPCTAVSITVHSNQSLVSLQYWSGPTLQMRGWGPAWGSPELQPTLVMWGDLTLFSPVPCILQCRAGTEPNVTALF